MKFLPHNDLLLSKGAIVSLLPLLMSLIEGLDMTSSHKSIPKIILVSFSLKLDGLAFGVSAVTESRHEESRRTTHIPHIVIWCEIKMNVALSLNQVAHDGANASFFNQFVVREGFI